MAHTERVTSHLSPVPSSAENPASSEILPPAFDLRDTAIFHDLDAISEDELRVRRVGRSLIDEVNRIISGTEQTGQARRTRIICWTLLNALGITVNKVTIDEMEYVDRDLKRRLINDDPELVASAIKDRADLSSLYNSAKAHNHMIDELLKTTTEQWGDVEEMYLEIDAGDYDSRPCDILQIIDYLIRKTDHGEELQYVKSAILLMIKTEARL